MAEAKKCDLCGAFYDAYPLSDRRVELYTEIEKGSRSVSLFPGVYDHGQWLSDFCWPCFVNAAVDAAHLLDRVRQQQPSGVREGAE